jgi:hypothetical protein
VDSLTRSVQILAISSHESRQDRGFAHRPIFVKSLIAALAIFQLISKDLCEKVHRANHGEQASDG